MLPRSSSQADLAMLFCVSSVPGPQNFSGGARGKEPTCQCRLNVKRCWFHPWVGKIPWRRTWQPTPVFLPGESHGHRGLQCMGSHTAGHN